MIIEFDDKDELNNQSPKFKKLFDGLLKEYKKHNGIDIIIDTNISEELTSMVEKKKGKKK